MTDLLSPLSRLLEPHQGARVVLALSGGLDSRLLLHVLARYRELHPATSVKAVHVHHGLSDNADEWAQLCGKWCREYQIPFCLEYAKLELSSKQSLEAQAREARYSLLKAHLSEGDILLTAQHGDDQLETLLLALKRGSGPAGLAAMGEVSSFADGFLVRPLLGFTRAELESEAQKYQLEWVEDESNQNTDFDRNFLRHEVIPKLSQRWPHIQASATRSAALCYEQEQLLQSLIKEKYQGLVSDDLGLNCEALLSCEPALQNQLLRMWLKQQGLNMPSQKQLGMIVDEVVNARPDANPRLAMKGFSVHRFQGQLYIAPVRDLKPSWNQVLIVGQEIDLPENLGSVGLYQDSEVGLKLRAPLAEEKVSIAFAPVGEGLVLHPEGRSGSRKLKKLFQEYQIPPWKRSLTPILMYNQEVVAVGDLFVCKAFSGQDCSFYWKQ